MIRRPRSVAIPLALTFLVLTGLTFAVADFKPIRVRILRVAPTGATPMLFLGSGQPRHTRKWRREYRVEGTAEEGLYAQIDGINLRLVRDDPSQYQGRNVIDMGQITLDRRSMTFSGTIWISGDQKEQDYYLVVGATNRIREIGPRSAAEDSIPWPLEQPR